MATNRIGFSTDFVLVNNKIGIGTTNPSSTLSVSVGSSSRALDIGTDLLVSGSGAFAPRVTVASTIGAASTQKMQISAVSRDNGLLEIENYGGNQLFSVSNNQVEDAFAIYRYANYDNLSITSFENRNLFRVGPLGIVTTYGAIRVGTSNTTANSSVFNQFYGNLNIRAPFSTATEYVSIVPKFSDRGALSFEAPVGTAQTDRGTQIFSISNNLSSSIFRVNDLNRNPIFEASASGRVGIGTTNPQAKLEVQGTTRVTSVGSTAGEQIDIRHYRNIGYGTAVNNKGAVSFDGSNSYSGYLGNLLTFVNDNSGTLVSVNRYDSFPGIVTAFNIDYSGAINGFRNIKINGNVDFGGGAVSIARSEKFTFNVFRNPGVTTFRDSVTAIGSTYVPVNAVGGGIGGQLLTITNDNDAYSLQINRNVGVNSLTPVTTGNVIINPSLTVDKYGEVRIYETYPDVLSSTRIIGFQTGNVAIGDGDLFRIDAYSSPFIGSFPTINTALKVDKYGTFNFRRNINQTSGITTVGVATTSTTLSVNATLSFELLNNGTLSIKVRGTDGVTRTGIVTLS